MCPGEREAEEQRAERRGRRIFPFSIFHFLFSIFHLFIEERIIQWRIANVRMANKTIRNRK
jgi:hypothetical protein